MKPRLLSLSLCDMHVLPRAGQAHAPTLARAHTPVLQHAPVKRGLCLHVHACSHLRLMAWRGGCTASGLVQGRARLRWGRRRAGEGVPHVTRSMRQRAS